MVHKRLLNHIHVIYSHWRLSRWRATLNEIEAKKEEQRQAARLWTRVIVRVISVLLAIAFGIWVLYALRTVLLLLVLSVFFCYLIAPLVRFFENPIYIGGWELKLPRGAAILLVYALIGGALFLVVQLVAPILGQQITSLLKEMPAYFSKWSASATKTIQGANKTLRGLHIPGSSDNDLAAWVTSTFTGLLPKIQDAIGILFGYLVYLPWLILVPILSFFMLKDAQQFAEELVALLPGPRLQRRANRLLIDISKTLAAYIRAQITSCLLIGTIVSAGLMILGVPYAVVIGAMAGVLEFIPMVGPLIAITAAFLIALINSVQLGLVVLLFMIVLRIAQDYIIYPRIIGQGIKMHPLLVILAIMCGAELDGVVGVFLAIPLVGLMMVAHQHYQAYRRTVMLGITDTGELITPSGAPVTASTAEGGRES